MNCLRLSAQVFFNSIHLSVRFFFTPLMSPSFIFFPTFFSCLSVRVYYFSFQAGCSVYFVSILFQTAQAFIIQRRFFVAFLSVSMVLNKWNTTFLKKNEKKKKSVVVKILVQTSTFEDQNLSHRFF